MQNDEGGYYRGLIINTSPTFTIFTWSGTILHEEIVRAITKERSKLKIPPLNYDSLYQSSIDGYFQDNWCFPSVYDAGTIRANLTKDNLIEFNKEMGIKKKFRLTDQQWTKMLSESW